MKVSESLLGRLIRNLPGMAYRCLHDADWTLEFVSDGSAELLGYTPDELVVERKVAVTDLTHPDDLAQVSLEVEAALSERRPFSMVYRMRTATGELKHISEVGRGIFRADGSLEALEGFLCDVTARVEAETALNVAQRREVLGQLSTGIAHDFNNLLHAIYGVADQMKARMPQDDPARASIESIVTVADKAKELTQQLTHLGKLERLAQHPIDLTHVMQSQLNLLSELAGPSEVVMTLEADSLPVAIDSTRFEQILLNLVGNARDAIDGAGKIELRLAKKADRALLEVTDNGAGMTAEVRAKAFGPFFTTKVPDRGTGLGLAIIHDTVTDCGGTIEVDSEPGKGAVFRLSLPLVTRKVPRHLPHDRPVGSEVVLLVEDEKSVRLVIARGLRRLGYTVFEAANGEQALSISRRHKGPIDLLLTDGKMPQMTGVDLARAFARDRPGAARILLTGDSVQAPDDLFLSVIRKPVRLQPLADQLRALLDAHGESEGQSNPEQ